MSNIFKQLAIYKLVFCFIFLCTTNISFGQKQYNQNGIFAIIPDEWVVDNQEKNSFIKSTIVDEESGFSTYVSIVSTPIESNLTSSDYKLLVASIKKQVEYNAEKFSTFKNKSLKFKSSISSSNCVLSYYEKPNAFEEEYYTKQMIFCENLNLIIITLKCISSNTDEMAKGEAILKTIVTNKAE